LTRAIRLVPDLTPSSPVIALKGVGPARARDLAAAGMVTIIDLLHHLPSRYEDQRQLRRIRDIQDPDRSLVRGRIVGLKRIRIRRRNLNIVRGWVVDETGELPVCWFNRPYLPNQVDELQDYLLFGEIRGRGDGFEMVNPSVGKADGERTPGIVPIYPAVKGVGEGVIRALIEQALVRCAKQEIVDPLPAALLRRHQLPNLARAIAELHSPPKGADLDAFNEGRSAAHARLSYGEFLELQVELGFLRGYETREPKPHSYRLDNRVRRVLLEVLPFRLTEAQRRALKEISRDLGNPYPMLRLLQGDVGSGKTIVAVLSLVMALENGLQGAFMAPTELLAEQHHRTLVGLLGDRYRVALLTGSVEQPERTREAIAAGSIQLVVGTHALIQEGTKFARLGLVVVDEQHRFGVAQRRHLQNKGEQPDLLVMTATPIPRSLALTVYGDLAFSVIDQLPPGRRPLETRVVPASRRAGIYAWLRERLAEGSQAYVVFPLIEESEQVKAASIEAMGERLRQFLTGVPSAVLHGRTSAREREEIMRRFRAGEVQVLVATTVIEVGVDVPNATIMLIESGERFGLSQLHQLRGRVGRGRDQSHCVVIHGATSEEARRRLEVFGRTSDGFEIAEADLEIRGPGDLLGTRQAGIPRFRAADIVRDRLWLERARVDALELIAEVTDSEPEPFLTRVRERARSRYESFAGG
jgi:ATP-dependent DNA helicase RecG